MWVCVHVENGMWGWILMQDAQDDRISIGVDRSSMVDR